MDSFKSIVEWIRGTDCPRIVKRTVNEIEISGASVGAGSVKIDVGKFSNKVKELAKATELAVTLDESQYLLCTIAAEMKDDPSMQSPRQEIVRHRIAIILAFSHLRALMATIEHKVAGDLRNELKEWIRYMSDLQKHAINAIGNLPPQTGQTGDVTMRARVLSIPPKRITTAPTKPTMTLGEIVRYLGIDEEVLDKAAS